MTGNIHGGLLEGLRFCAKAYQLDGRSRLRMRAGSRRLNSRGGVDLKRPTIRVFNLGGIYHGGR
jgi:hypothetical protein